MMMDDAVIPFDSSINSIMIAVAQRCEPLLLGAGERPALARRTDDHGESCETEGGSFGRVR